MNRDEKIAFLKEIKEGKSTIECLLPTRVRAWKQQLDNPDVFYCKEDDLYRTKDVSPVPDKKGQHVVDIFIYRGLIDLVENEEDVVM